MWFQRIQPIPKTRVTFHNKLFFDGEELTAPRLTPTLEEYPLSAVRDCLSNLFAAKVKGKGKGKVVPVLN
jgi:hypothetical protein